MKNTLPLCLLAVSLNSPAQTIVDSLRVDWSTAGFEGSIPAYANIIDVTSFGAVANDTLDDASAVSSAISSLNGNAGVIYFPAGNYVFHSSLNVPDSTVLRGAGSDSTLFTFNFNDATANSINIATGASGAFTPISSGYLKGSAELIVVNAGSIFSPGDEIEIREANGSWDTNPANWAEFSVGHLSRVDAVNGDTLWMHDALRIDFDAALNPEIRKIVTRKYCGLECFKMTREDGNAPSVNYGVNFLFASDCWMFGVESEKSIGAHVNIETSSHIDITGCYFHEGYFYDGASTRGYGVMIVSHSCLNKVEDNIFRMLRHAMITKQGANGNVFGYNYSREPNRSEAIADYAADMCLHGHYAFANLYEGNIGQNLQIDQAWGPSGPFNTFFRNKIELYGIIMSSGTVQSDRQNFVGNDVSNTTLFHGLYMLTGSGHFEFGNNVRGTITPAGTTNLPDTSYYLTVIQPPFWNIPASLPSVGIPNTFTSDINPALQRYIDGGTLTRCGFTPDTNITTHISQPAAPDFTFSNLFFKEGALHVSIESAQAGEVTLQLLAVTGQEVFTKRLHAEAGINQWIIPAGQGLSEGIYMVRLSGSSIQYNSKLLLRRME